ncbi:extracellular solute-binding protein, partial [bacterium]|nr:extracellular solute-binding protein [bacterium]
KFYDPETKKFTFADDPKILAALKWEKTYADKYGIKNIDAFFSAFGGGAAQPVDPFLMGREAMRVDGNWFLSTLRKFANKNVCDWGIAPIPYPKGGEKNSTWAAGWSLVIPKGARHPKEAAEFILWMATKGAVKYALDTAHFSAYKEGTLKLVEADPEQKLFYELLTGPNAHYLPVVPIGALMWDKLTDAWNYALYGQKTPEQALRDTQEELQKELDKVLSEIGGGQ